MGDWGGQEGLAGGQDNGAECVSAAKPGQHLIVGLPVALKVHDDALYTSNASQLLEPLLHV